MPKKRYVTAQSLLEDSYRLASKVYESGFRPDFLVAIWRGGTPVGIAVQEFLSVKGVETDHIAVRTSAYTTNNRRKRQIRVHSTGHLESSLKGKHRVLVVDDVWDTGLSVQALLRSLKRKLGKDMPEDIRVATVYWKPSKNKTKARPDFCIHKTDQWIVFPHELHGLDKKTISKVKGKSVARLLD